MANERRPSIRRCYDDNTPTHSLSDVVTNTQGAFTCSTIPEDSTGKATRRHPIHTAIHLVEPFVASTARPAPLRKSSNKCRRAFVSAMHCFECHVMRSEQVSQGLRAWKGRRLGISRPRAIAVRDPRAPQLHGSLTWTNRGESKGFEERGDTFEGQSNFHNPV